MKIIKILVLGSFTAYASNSFALSLDDKLGSWHTASYSEQAKMCESIANSLKRPSVTASGLCSYLSEIASSGEADFMRISQVAAVYATVAK
ncbi:MAG: hypothetical protein WCI06_09660 [Methylococcaceae bacterium]